MIDVDLSEPGFPDNNWVINREDDLPVIVKKTVQRTIRMHSWLENICKIISLGEDKKPVEVYQETKFIS